MCVIAHAIVCNCTRNCGIPENKDPGLKRTQGGPRTEDPGPEEDPGPKEDPGPEENPGPTIKVKNLWTNGKICAKVPFPRYTESVKVTFQSRETASKRKPYRGLGTR